MVMESRSHKLDINRPRCRHTKTNVQNIACLGKTAPLCNKQKSMNIWGSIH